MMASVSSTAREYLGGRSGFSLSIYGMNSARVRKRQPLANCTSSAALPGSPHSARNSSSRTRMVSEDTSSSNILRKSVTVIGWTAHNNAASRVRLSASGVVGMAIGRAWAVRREVFVSRRRGRGVEAFVLIHREGEADVNRRKGFGLRQVDQLLAG